MDLVEAERILKLAKFLRTVPEEMFDMRDFGKTRGVESDKLLVLSLENPVCGSAGCALGWATVVFPETFFLKKCIHLTTRYGLYFRGDVIGYTLLQVCDFFGINPATASFLFAPIQRTAKEVADNIEAVARRSGWCMKDDGTIETVVREWIHDAVN